MRSAVLLLISLCVSTFCFASTAYLSGAPRIVLYDADSGNANMIATLNTGSAVEILKADLKEGYSFVKTDKGLKGWVQSIYLTQEDKPKNSGNMFQNAWQKVQGFMGLKKESSDEKSDTDANVTQANLTPSDNQEKLSTQIAKPTADKNTNQNTAKTSAAPNEQSTLIEQQKSLLASLQSKYSLNILAMRKQITELQSQSKTLESQYQAALEKNKQTTLSLQKASEHFKYWLLISLLIGFLIGFLLGRKMAPRHRSMFS